MRGELLAASAAKLGVVFFLLATLCYGQVSVLTQRNDPARDGLNASETALTLSNVSVGNFGKLFNFPVDGYLYAQPLYVAGVVIPGNGTHNVVYAATMHDTIFAYDADGLTLQPLWTANLAALGCPSGFTCTSVPSGTNYTSGPDILPEIGILSTPVIDSSTNPATLYAVAKTQETSGSTTNYVYRLHALDITTGAERTTPVAIQGQVQGTGVPNSGGYLVFSPLYSLQRPALALVNTNIYIGFGAAGDQNNWHGWIFGYDKTALTQTAVFSPTPNGSEGHGGIWMHGSGLASDASGNLYFSTGNGAFDGTTNFGDSFLKLSTPGLTVADYFTPYNQADFDSADLDVASGGLALLPASAGTAQYPDIMIGCAKNGAIYVIDRDNMGQFNSSNDNAIIQELLNVIGDVTVNPTSTAYEAVCFSSPAFWQGYMYIGGVADSLKMFDFSNGLLSSSAVSQSVETYQFPGTNPVVSANGTSNGIVWAIENNGTPNPIDLSGTAAILHAYNATNLSSELYNSAQVASDAAGAPVKNTVPTIANGKVYVGTQTSVAVYGLYSATPPASAPSFSIPGGTYSSAVTVSITEATAGTTVYYTTDGSTPTTSSNIYSTPITIAGSATLSAMAVGGGYRTSPVTTATYVISSGFSFAQVAAATPQSPTATVPVAYPGAQTAGNLNVVVVGWNDTTATVQSVKDSGGNNYSLAIGPTSGTALRQSIYYAPNIKAGSNTVTVTFSQAAVAPDVRILEYRGVNTVDVTAGASGSSTAANSGATTTTSANELIFGAATVFTGVTGAGSGFTARIITSPDSDLAEDEVVTTTGSNSATAPVSPSGPWVMQMVTFLAVSGPAPTVSSVSPNSGSTAGGTAVTITGTNFAAGATVTFGGTAATNVVVVNSTTITATTPAGSAGAATVTVTVNGQSGSLPNGYTYVVAPTVSSVSPNNGLAAGGTAVTITGTNFAAGATVTFGGTAATNVVVANTTTITATTPAGSAGAVTVTVTVNGQSGSLTNGFTYVVPPTVSSLSPSTGSTGGGTAVTITGANFVAGATVTFGGTAATNVVVVNSTTITATTPAGSAGAVTVTVTNPGAQSGSLANGYTYVVVPTVSSVSPNNGPAAGGTAVTITGTNFAAGATVTFGGTAATNVVVVNSTTITATTPAGSAGAVTVTVTVNGQSGSLTNGYTYNGAVAIGFAQVAAATPQSPTATVPVAYPGAQTAGNLNVVVVGWNDTTATVQSVKDSGGNNYSLAIGPTSGTALRQSIYYAPNIKAGSNTVTVTFSQAAVAPDVRILEYRGVNTVDVTAGASGSSTAANSGATTTTSANELIFGAATVFTGVTGAGSGFTARIITSPDSDLAEDEVVTTTGSNSATAPVSPSGPWVMQMVTFLAVSGPAPTVSSVSPNSGSTAGGTAVTITGTNFAAGATVTFGGTAATNVVVVNSTTITATTPAGSAGAATVTVTVNGQSGSLPNGYTYVVAPTVSSVSPNNGLAAGGTAVTITGTNFAAGATVTFGGTAATNVVVANTTTITATTPAGSAGAVTVTVTVNGQSGSLTNGFTYVVPPTVSSLSPSTGSTGGGTAVTITGANFVAGATVTFGGTAATNVVVVNSTTITATTPAGSAGAVTVTVTNPGAQSGSLANGYTYVVVPTVSSVSPNNGPAAGGTAVTITGTNFAAGATVTFGGTAATNVVVVNSTTITATTPAGSAGAVTVTVTVNGQSGSLTNGYTYNGAVAIGFAQVAAATPQSPTATVPVAYPGAQTAGNLNVVVVGWNDTTATVQSVKDSGGNNYSLAIGPTSGTALRQSIYYAPNIKAGSNTVTVTFSQAAVAPDVRILEYRGVNTVDVTAGASGSSTAANSGATTTTSANELIFGANMVYTTTGAAGSGFTSRVITNPDGDIAEDKVVTTTGSNNATATLTSSGPWVMQMVTFLAVSGPAPTVSSVSPNTGSTGGGTAVTIAGTNFAAGATVTFGGAAATNVVVVNSTTITATTPAGGAGAVTVTVTNPGSQSGNLANGFTYAVVLAVSSVSPNNGLAAGGTAVTITGTNFASGATVTFGGTAATDVVVVSSTTITATTPASSAGAVTVTVTVNGQSGSLTNGFTYIGVPTVSSVSPNSGSTAGGTAVTITGTNFAAGATVTFGGTATSVAVVNSTTITATTPAGAAGAVTVTVTNPGSQSGNLANGFSYAVVPTLVQHVSSSNTRNNDFSSPYCYHYQLPNLTTAGNLVVVGFTFNSDPTPTVSDDQGNSYSIQVNYYDSADTQSIAIATAFNIVAGARVISVCFSSDPGGYVQPMATEFDNVVGIDAAAASQGSGTSVTAGSMTPTVVGDLAYQVVFNMPIKQSAFTAGAQSNISWSLLSADLMDGWAAQYGLYNSTSAINPTLTMGTSQKWVSAAVLLKPGTSGSVPSGMRIVHLMHENIPVPTAAGGTGNPFANPLALQFPSSGNLLVAMIGGGLACTVTSITDTNQNAWTQAGATQTIAGNDTVQAYYAQNAVSGNLGLTVNWSATDGDQTIFFYDVTGAATSPLDTTAGSSGSQSVAGNLTMPFTITPAGANEIIFEEVIWDNNTASGLVGQGQFFDTNTFDGESQSGPEPVDANNGWGHALTTSTAPVAITWETLYSGLPVGNWAGMAAAFTPAP